MWRAGKSFLSLQDKGRQNENPATFSDLPATWGRRESCHQTWETDSSPKIRVIRSRLKQATRWWERSDRGADAKPDGRRRGWEAGTPGNTHASRAFAIRPSQASHAKDWRKTPRGSVLGGEGLWDTHRIFHPLTVLVCRGRTFIPLPADRLP